MVLLKVYKDIWERGLLTPTMRSSVTVLIPKKRDVAEDIPAVTDFRPLSLLCTDYKILAKILAKRLDSILWKVIGQHQCYGIKKRSIQRNLHAMRTVCETAQTTGTMAGVLQVDLKQAFDRVAHSFLLSLLNKVGAIELSNWVKICYEDIRTAISITGALGNEIKIERGVRQGCPMSPVLFALYLEPKYCRGKCRRGKHKIACLCGRSDAILWEEGPSCSMPRGDTHVLRSFRCSSKPEEVALGLARTMRIGARIFSWRPVGTRSRDVCRSALLAEKRSHREVNSSTRQAARKDFAVPGSKDNPT